MFENLLNPVLNPLLALPLLAVVILLSFLITLIITLIYKYSTNQDLMKQLKEETKELQKEMKLLKDNPARMMEIQRQAMATNMKYMKQSFRSTLYTFIPIILLFGWMNAHLQFEPLRPNAEFTLSVAFQNSFTGDVALDPPKGISVIGPGNRTAQDGLATFVLKGSEGDYALPIKAAGKEYLKEIKITGGKEYVAPLKAVNDEAVKQITLGNKEIKLINIFGWKLGWLGTYIILSIIFSTALRKLFKVY
ncbi:DUF106 domain-containing protein [Candidatus Woesearchaeota archaeon]|nr:DUF106 domain-containing protein [Candidatus Woesearchaeota archaeon]